MRDREDKDKNFSIIGDAWDAIFRRHFWDNLKILSNGYPLEGGAEFWMSRSELKKVEEDFTLKVIADPNKHLREAVRVLRAIDMGDGIYLRGVKLRFDDDNELDEVAQAVSKELDKEGANKEGKKKAEANEEELSVDAIKSMEDSNDDEIIANHIIYKKKYKGVSKRFFVKVYVEDGEIKEELELERSISEQTAPTPEFYKRQYRSIGAIYKELKTTITDYIAFRDDDIYPTLIALGSMASYFREIFYTFPYFDYISSEPECGKTTALKVQTFTGFYGTIASSVTEALLFREIDESHCFYGLDNIERIFKKPRDYIAIIDWLLSSYSRDIPCKRLEKINDRYVVTYFDGYGIKGFTHIRDFPFELRALKSRCIQIIMQPGRPKKFYPTSEKFADVRDKLYNARLREHELVKKTYDALVNTNILIGRTGDLFYPLLTIAQLIDKKDFEQVFNYARAEEVDRTEQDEWNKTLILLLYEDKLYGSQATKDIAPSFSRKLVDLGLIDPEKGNIPTRTVTTKLKKLGFKRENKTTDNKTWFLIVEQQVKEKCYEYGILDTPKSPNLPNLVDLSDFLNEEEKTKEGGIEEKEDKEKKRGKKILDNIGDDEQLGKLSKLAKMEVCQKENKKLIKDEGNICDKCGGSDATELYKNCYFHPNCLDEEKQEEKPTKLILNVCEETAPCQKCGYTGTWGKGIDLPFIVYYSTGGHKTICKRCGEEIAREYNLKMPTEDTEVADSLPITTRDISFDIKEAREFLIKQGHVYTLRNPRTEGIGYVKHDGKKIALARITKVADGTESAKYWMESGFLSHEAWLSAVRNMKKDPEGMAICLVEILKNTEKEEEKQ